MLQLSEAGVPAQQLGHVVDALTSGKVGPLTFAGSMAALHALLGDNWQAAADAAAQQPGLLQLAGSLWTPELVAACRQLAQTGLDPDMRLALIQAAKYGDGWLPWQHFCPATFLSRLELLSALLGSWQAAAEHALANTRLMRLPDTDAMRRVASGLNTAGLEEYQLLRLAEDLATGHYDHAEILAAIADQLYGGDWRAAALKWLQDPALRNLASHSRLRLALRTWQQLGVEVTNDRGRERVVHFVKGDRTVAQAWRVTLPDGTPAEERWTVAEAALEAEGFRAMGGQAAQGLAQLAEVSWAVEQCTSLSSCGAVGQGLVVAWWAVAVSVMNQACFAHLTQLTSLWYAAGHHFRLRDVNDRFQDVGVTGHRQPGISQHPSSADPAAPRVARHEQQPLAGW